MCYTHDHEYTCANSTHIQSIHAQQKSYLNNIENNKVTTLLKHFTRNMFRVHGIMKSTKVQTLGALYACAPLIDGLDHATRSMTYLSANRLASCVIMSGFRAALDLDTYLLCKLIRPLCAERAKPG